MSNLSNDLFRNDQVTDALAEELAAYCDDHGIELSSADELVLTYQAIVNDPENDDDEAVLHLDYFQAYVARWDAMAERDVLLTKECGEVSISNLGAVDEDEARLEEMHDKHESSNLKTTVPNIVLRIGGVEHLLTWDEAMAIGIALQTESRICEFG